MDKFIGEGHNMPPQDLKEEVEQRYFDVLNQVTELLDAAATVPEDLDEHTQPKAAELIKKIRFLETTLDGARKLEKEPFDAKVKLINGVFNTRIERLEAQRKKINERSSAYLERKAAAEKRRLAEEEDARRAKAAADLKAAQEAEQKRLDAERRQRQAEEDARVAEENRLRAIKDKEDAERRAQEARDRETQLRIERQQREERERQDAAEKKQRDEAESKRRQETLAKERADIEQARADRQKADGEADESKRKADEARAEQRKAEGDAHQHRQDAKSHGRDEKASLDNAVREETRADKIAGRIEGPEADLARTRSEHGAVSTLSRIWTCRVVNRDALDKARLWPFIDADALETATRKWMLTQEPQNRTMPGAVMQQETVGQVR